VQDGREESGSAGPNTAGPVSVIVVSFESASVLARCLVSLQSAAPKRGLDLWVVDNASSDDSASIAARHMTGDRVLRLAENRGFAAGVNAGLVKARGPWIAIVNPDTIVPPGTFDTLADLLERHPRAGLVAPRVIRPDGRPEASAGRFPTPVRERNHALKLDRIRGLQGRTCQFPTGTGPVDWASGCAWLLRAEAVRETGPLDEDFFMYFEDVDYCRRLWATGWQVLATADAELTHATGQGSLATATIAAEGAMGRGVVAPLRYFSKHLATTDAVRAARWLVRGWRLRALAHTVCGWLGRERSVRDAARYRLALARVRPR
jgi:GT2 family glycosyltransferase